ncbi:hypothetical protein [Sphingomonas sp.]|jgi:hypothetical protein|uniref:hypothetical protein n=1 Tax=Sphingomonas sp. TaxID=28214 RepID=UPI002D802A63|nr:hypothetical protein [Sphingomonas sp.]HEU0043100.1 hypothetical protein [Sphingomonas sp.]
MTTGWKLDRAERDALLRRFPPRWPDADADHVTLWSSKSEHAGVPPADPHTAEIVGHVDDGIGLEAMVIRLNGTTDRPDGSTFHITWSLDAAAARESVESNAVLRARGWTAFDQPVPIALTGARW